MNHVPHILVVDDDSEIRQMLADYLQRNGLRVSQADGGRAMRALMDTHAVDLVVLDVMMPGEDGLSLCRNLRAGKHRAVPVVLLTARDDETDRIIGLEMGADDYVTKPCEPRVLLARVRTLLRRSSVNEPRLDNDLILIGGLRIDLAERTVSWRGEEVELSSGEYNLLVVLARNAGEVLNRDRILQQLRGIEFNGTDRSVDVAISKLRRKFDDNAGEARKIKTVWGKGYLFSRVEWEC